MMPAPSPEMLSAEHAPRCSMHPKAVTACDIQSLQPERFGATVSSVLLNIIHMLYELLNMQQQHHTDLVQNLVHPFVLEVSNKPNLHTDRISEERFRYQAG